MNEDLFYLGIKLLISNSADQILLLLRSASHQDDQGHWDIPGGRILRGEDIETALGREIQEETGLQLDNRDITFIGAHLSNSRVSMGKSDAGLILFITPMYMGRHS